MAVIHPSAKSEPRTWNWFAFMKSVNTLNWYDTFTSFVFRFMAKTSEPLLAAGIILSAIDFLQRGQLLAHNPTLALAWSCAQGIAMEVSVGPVLVCSLDAREEQDIVKAKLYAALAGLLASVGGAMLFMQFIASILGVSEPQITPYVLYPLFVLRTVASIGYIALSCTKHKRFSGSVPVPVNSSEQNTVNVSVIQELMTQVDARIAQLEASYEKRLQVVTEQYTRVQVTLEESQKLLALPLPVQAVNRSGPQIVNSGDKKQQVKAYLSEHPNASISEVIAGLAPLGVTVSKSYVSGVRSELQEGEIKGREQ